MKFFLTHSDDVKKSGVIWNMIASISMSFQSVILLIVISHTLGLGLVPAGIYTMGNTLNNLFLCIGKYGIRPFQVSDVKWEYSFKVYKIARIITVLAMGIISVVYVIYARNAMGYSLEKTIIIIWMCIYKLPDAYEDVYYGEYQRNNRLDIAAKAAAIRYIFSIVLWALLIVITKDMVIAVSVTSLFTFIVMFWFINITKEYAYVKNESDLENINAVVNNKRDGVPSSVIRLLVTTAPLAISSFLAIYIGTAPRLSIDRIMDDASQAIYGYIAMPVFIIQVMMMFVLNPVMYKISCFWDEKKYSEYIQETIKQILIVGVFTVICLVGASLLGVPILSCMYHVDLQPYKIDLIIMMVGSGLLALSTVLQVLLTIMRKQKTILGGYIIVSIVAMMASDRAVDVNGINGAVILYIIILVLLNFLYLVGYIYYIRKLTKKLKYKV